MRPFQAPPQPPQTDWPQVCGQCGAVNIAGAAVCAQCGGALAAPGRPSFWSPSDVTRGAVVVLVAAVALIAAGLGLIKGLGLDTVAATLIISGGLEFVLIGTAWGFGPRKHRLPWASLGFRLVGGSTRLGLALGTVLASLGLVAVYALALDALGFEDALPKPELFEDTSRTGIIIAATLLAVVLAPLGEEAFFRGFVFGGLKRTMGPWAAAVISAGLFTLAHISLATFIPIFLIGLLLAFVYLKTGSLWYSVLTHMSYNALVVYVNLR